MNATTGIEGDNDGIGPGDDHIRFAGHNLPGQVGVALVMPLSGIAFNDQILSFNVAQAA
jgi:hypothetical protein